MSPERDRETEEDGVPESAPSEGSRGGRRNVGTEERLGKWQRGDTG